MTFVTSQKKKTFDKMPSVPGLNFYKFNPDHVRMNYRDWWLHRRLPRTDFDGCPRRTEKRREETKKTSTDVHVWQEEDPEAEVIELGSADAAHPQNVGRAR